MADREDITVPENERTRIEGDIVAIEVGDTTKEIFHVHKKLLMTRSAYFKKALQYAGSAFSRLKVANVEIATFDLYVQYIYTGRLPYKTIDESFGTMVDLYLAAGRLEDFDTMNAAIDAMLVFHTAEETFVPNSSIIQKVYKATEPGSEIRRLFVDMHLWSEDPDLIDEADDDPRDFLVDFSKAALKQLKAKSGDEEVASYETASCCNYHEHSNGAKCNNRKRKRDDSDDAASEDEEARADSLSPA
ncbi:hypothetical protein CBER1_06016 [Cercospora berteroae]|uniref:BTB domain-containing protein n=1 Tax=Cercospora berteroae TaxID=357750 RepID=A0A2S6C4P0_9PEZI|nr:hypothetical protein CBER1_06016 [Cercospora berteroae]